MDLLKIAQNTKTSAIKHIKKRSARHLIRRNLSNFKQLPSGDKAYRAAIYFADSKINIYQIRQWYQPFVILSTHIPVVVLVRNPEMAVILQRECPLPIYYAATIAEVEDVVATQSLGAIFYVNQNIRNFQMLRFNNISHTFISHGESEKAYMWSNQLKAYDYVFVAGDAARDRLAKNLTGFDVLERTRAIGRPQLDVDYKAPLDFNPLFKTILYAPTWEGDRPSMSYGSVSSHGVGLIKDLVTNGTYNIIFRPHPRSGVNNPEYRRDIEEIRSILQATGRDPGGPTYFYDDSPSWGWQWSSADACITDMSAVAYDWLATGKPVLITRPADPHAAVGESPALMKLPSLNAEEAHGISAIIRPLIESPAPDHDALVRYHFGDTSRGSSCMRFITAALEVAGSPQSQLP